MSRPAYDCAITWEPRGGVLVAVKVIELERKRRKGGRRRIHRIKRCRCGVVIQNQSERCRACWLADLAAKQARPSTAAHDIVACPTCGARADELCRSPKGTRNSRGHAERIMPRCCPCGAPVEGQKAYCDSCREWHIKEARRGYMRRTRAQARRAA